MHEIPLSEFGLITVAGACARRGWSPKTVQNWVNGGLLAVVPVGSGRGTYLLRIADVDAFTPPPRGRPATKKPAPEAGETVGTEKPVKKLAGKKRSKGG